MHEVRFMVSLIFVAILGVEQTLGIIGGKNTTIQEYPYQLALESVGWQKCGAAIISNYWALTAAHCVFRSHVFLVKLRAGSSDREDGGMLHQVTQIIKHPKFDSKTNNYDIAMLKVETPFVYGSGVQPIPLTKTVPATGEVATITGWGVTAYKGKTSPRLKVAFIRIVDHEVCNQDFMESYNGTTKYMFCAGVPEGGQDSCNNDSGGPLVVNGKLAGIVSWGENCGVAEYPGVYTNVALFRDFIYNHTGVE